MPRLRTIFVIDDDRDFLELERSMLASQGYRVTCFTDSQAALAALQSGTPGAGPDLIVTDLMMASLDAGFTFSRALKSDPTLSRIPVIVVSAVSSQKGFDFRPRSAEDLAAMGADAWFDKPVAAGPFLAKVKELLG